MGCSSSSRGGLLADGQESKAPGHTPVSVCDIHPVLSTEQCMLIRNTWKTLSADSLNVGKALFLRIFELRPQIKTLFPFKDAWGDELIRHPLFLAHSARFLMTIGEAIEQMEALDSYVRPRIYALGQTHVDHEGFTSDYFDIFLKSMMLIWHVELKEDYTAETRQAWKILLEFIIEELKRGYNEEMSSRKGLENGGHTNEPKNGDT